MKAVLTITDVTRMQDRRVCVAGYLPNDVCVRPVLRGGLTEGWLSIGRRVVVRPFARVELDLLEAVPDPPHAEDWAIDPIYRAPRGMLAPAQRLDLLERISGPSLQALFGAPLRQDVGTYVRAGEGVRSLGTVIPAQVLGVGYAPRPMGKWDYRLAFVDQDGRRYRLSVTDLAFRYLLDSWRLRDALSADDAARHLTAMLTRARVVLRVGLARGWARYPDRCYVQLTGVYSFPDYLDGRCFADLDPCAYTEADVPF